MPSPTHKLALVCCRRRGCAPPCCLHTRVRPLSPASGRCACDRLRADAALRSGGRHLRGHRCGPALRAARCSALWLACERARGLLQAPAPCTPTAPPSRRASSARRTSSAWPGAPLICTGALRAAMHACTHARNHRTRTPLQAARCSHQQPGSRVESACLPALELGPPAAPDPLKLLLWSTQLPTRRSPPPECSQCCSLIVWTLTLVVVVKYLLVVLNCDDNGEGARSGFRDQGAARPCPAQGRHKWSTPPLAAAAGGCILEPAVPCAVRVPPVSLQLG